MKDRDKKFVCSIINHIENIEDYVNRISSLDDFSSNSLIQDAVLFNLLQIGEISKTKISDAFKKKYSDIPWDKIYGFRNRLVHDYDNIILTVVYEIVIDDLTTLKNKFLKIQIK